MLALAPGVAYVHEPFSPRAPKGLSPAGFERYFTVVTSANERRYRDGVKRSLDLRYDIGAQVRSARNWRDIVRIPRDYGRLRRRRGSGRRPLMKDPIALLAEWLADSFGMGRGPDPPPGRLRGEPEAARLEAQLRDLHSGRGRARGGAAV
jgi:hypothetical protein